VGGVEITQDDFARLASDVRANGERLVAQGILEALPTFFEQVTMIAFIYFAERRVDIAIFEVGMGGRLDATNISEPAVTAITPVGYDHQQYLGNTLAEIAGEKAGIIKPGAVAVLGQQPLAAAEVLLRRAAEVGATVAREGLEFGVVRRELAVGGQVVALRGLAGEYGDLLLPLFGEYQAMNAACALAAVEAFASGGPGGEPLGEELVQEAFAMVTSPGRLEVLRRSPVVIADSAHNPAGMAASVAAVTEAFSFRTLIAVLAISEDKDVPAVLDQLEPAADALVVTRNHSDRTMDPGKLADLAAGVFGPDRVRVADRLDDAIELAVGLADEAAADGLGGSGVLVTGSVVTAGDARVLLGAGGDAGDGRPGGADLG
jgi:dihydrofolate synthase/folylpolyglutamate synthase